MTSAARKPFAIGVDLGGTKILAAVVEVATGRVVSSAKKRTVDTSAFESIEGKPKDRFKDKTDTGEAKPKDKDKSKDHKDKAKDKDGGQLLLERVGDVVREALASAGPDFKLEDMGGIGFGVAGQVDREKGVLVAAPNLGVAPQFPIQQLMEAEFKLPVALGNDVEVATLGELHFGSGQNCPNFICIFVGTGIGGGIVQDGIPYRGATNTAGEVGHIVVAAGGRYCGCGGRGHLEAYCSRTAITRSILAELHRGRPSIVREQLPPGILPDPNTATSVAIRSKAIARALAANDELVIEITNEAAEYLAYGLASVINLYNPQRIILGGGLIEAVDPFFERVVKTTKQEALGVPAASIEIVRTKLGDFSGVVGAALLSPH